MVCKQNPSLHFSIPSSCESYRIGEIEESASLFPLLSNWPLFKEEQIKAVSAGRGLRDPVTPISHCRAGEKEAQRGKGACIPVRHFTRSHAAAGSFQSPTWAWLKVLAHGGHPASR